VNDRATIENATIGNARGAMRWAVALLALAIAGCSSSGGTGTQTDAAVDYITFDVPFGDLPPGCPPAMPNEKGIGTPCTKGGNECKGGLLCACEPHANIQPPAGTPCVCTQLIFSGCDTVSVGYCGQGATCCSYMNAVSICVPLVCLENATCPML
jgi:hypothetical protein